MINVKVVPNQERIYPKDLYSCTFYSCKRQTSTERRVFFIAPQGPVEEFGNAKKIVIWVSSAYSASGLSYDYFPILKEKYCDFQKVENAELTFYV